jgi:hypothetical protein
MDHLYQLPLGFEAEAYVEDALVVMRGGQIAVELVFEGPPPPGHAIASGIRARSWSRSATASSA